MKPSLQVRLSQHLALTPQLQQSIRLLQLSTLELQQEVETMLEENPFLERDDEAGDDARPVEASSPAFEDAPARDTAEDVPEAPFGDDLGESGMREFEATDLTASALPDWDNGAEREDLDGGREPVAGTGDAGATGEGSEGYERDHLPVSLAAHLREQLRGMRLGPDDTIAVDILIDSLNEDGYLDGSLDDIVARMAQVLGIEVDGPQPQPGGAGADEADESRGVAALRERMHCALRWLQSMEPTGVGARDLPECLSLQLRALPRSEAQAVAVVIANRHLDLLARKDMRRLLAATGVDEALLKAAHLLILACEPKPGRQFAPAESNIIVPDVIVQRAGRGWRVVLNPDVMPKLRINDVYARALRQHRQGEGGQAMATRLQEARWFVKNILQRFDTIQRVSRAIVERQKSFFAHGAVAMKPLVLREIAEELGLHESTISRVTTAKYMATPHGTFELKYFFGSALATDAGGEASSTAVRALIRQFIEAENKDAPLSDSQLSQMLEEQGIQVARRTVAKYREGMRIAAANLRRSL